mmetsp:Transcript_16934/g.27514  ORF Transcript_16934/g.27514 Transcript_16934/m.27514 type:complete len:176 (+) Transcript_16934:480-1007(+)
MPFRLPLEADPMIMIMIMMVHHLTRMTMVAVAAVAMVPTTTSRHVGVSEGDSPCPVIPLATVAMMMSAAADLPYSLIPIWGRWTLRTLCVESAAGARLIIENAMFGDESDEEAKGKKKEYTYKQKKAKAARARNRKNDNDDENESESENNEDSDNNDTPNTMRRRQREYLRRMLK